jgi:hypothetical protein
MEFLNSQGLSLVEEVEGVEGVEDFFFLVETVK